MAIGLAVTKQEVDNLAAKCVLQLRETFEDIERLQTYLNATPNADLVALGYTEGTPNEVAILKSGSLDLDQLRRIWKGEASLPSAKDFRTFSGKFTGVR